MTRLLAVLCLLILLPLAALGWSQQSGASRTAADIARAESAARVAEANAQTADAQARAVAAEQATARHRATLATLPVLVALVGLSVGAAIVLWYRGRIAVIYATANAASIGTSRAALEAYAAQHHLTAQEADGAIVLVDAAGRAVERWAAD